MASASSSPQQNAKPDDRRGVKNDWRLFLRLLPYIKRNRSQLVVPLLLLLPLSLAQAIQPVLIGQAISLIKQENAAWAIFSR